MGIPKEKKYTAEEFLSFSETKSELMELINGEIVYLASPSTAHQRLVMQISSAINFYIKSNKGKCEVFPAPFDIVLENNSVVIPDISIICDKSKIDSKRCNGSPDLVIEIVSSNRYDDYVRKLSLYEKFGVREYWIVDPKYRRIITYCFESGDFPNIYTFDMSIPVNIYNGDLLINIDELLK